MTTLRITEKADQLLVEVHVVPRAARSKVLGVHDGRLKIALAAPPVAGAANAALIAFVAELLDVPRRDVELCRGATARHKLLAIRGTSAARIAALSEP
jgi:uncharacterized protein (TIGR00251 family)